MFKKILCVLLAVTATYFAVPSELVAGALECCWARVTKEDVYIFADEECSKMMFMLEKSYYVEILATLDATYQVAVMQGEANFPTVMGYVRKIEVTPVEVAPLSPVYPCEQILVTTDSAQLKLLPLDSSEIVIVATTTQKLNYYGKLRYYNKDWYYVYCAGKFGYVNVKDVSTPSIAPHPTPLQDAKPVIKPQQPDDGTEQPDPNDKNATPTAEILLIAFVAVLAGGLTLALFLPGNGKKADVFEQDI